MSTTSKPNWYEQIFGTTNGAILDGLTKQEVLDQINVEYPEAEMSVIGSATTDAFADAVKTITFNNGHPEHVIDSSWFDTSSSNSTTRAATALAQINQLGVSAWLVENMSDEEDWIGMSVDAALELVNNFRLLLAQVPETMLTA